MTRSIRTVKVTDLISAGNVRTEVGDITDLAKSIESVGLLSPLLVTGTREAPTLIAGHRRLAAVQALGWDEVEAIFLAEDSTASRVTTQLVENLQREDLNPLEEAAGLTELVAELGSQARAAEAVGRSKAYVSKALKLLTLTDSAQAAVAAGDITATDAYEVARLTEPEHQRQATADLLEGRPDRARATINRLSKEEARPSIERKAAKAVAGQKHRKDTPVMALIDAEAEHKAGKPIEGWAGIAVDFDEHQAEPCNLLVVGFHQAWADEPTEVFWCTDPSRHEPDGDSPVKVIRTNADTEAEARELERAKAREAAEARVRAAVKYSTELSDRNIALKLLAMHAIRGTDLETLQDAMRAVGVEMSEPDIGRMETEDYRETEARLVKDLLEAKVTQLWRVAVMLTTVYAVGAHYLDPMGTELLKLAGLEGTE